jgi:hypothetical protein
LHNIAANNIIQRLYKNEILLFKDFQDFLSRKQYIPEKRLPYYVRWASRFHKFCSRRNIDGGSREAFTACFSGFIKKASTPLYF